MKRLTKLFTLVVAMALTLPLIAAEGEDMKSTWQVPVKKRTVASKALSKAALKTQKARVPLRIAEDASSIDLWGSVIYSTNYTNYGMSKVPTTTDGAFELIAEGVYAYYGGVEADGKYYSIYDYGGYCYLDIRDSETWEQLSLEKLDDYTLAATDVALDPTTGVIYGCFQNDDENGYVFGTINYNTKTRTAIADVYNAYFGIAVDADGTIYVIDAAGDLKTVNKVTGAETTIGSTELSPYYAVSATIDPATGRLFFTHSPIDNYGYLYEIDKTTAEAALLLEFPADEEVTGLYVPSAIAEDLAPAAVTNLAIAFEGDALTGTVTFTAPTTTYNGEEASGDLTYTVRVDGEVLATGSTTYGAEVSTQITLATAGQYEVVAFVSNEVGDGPKSSVTAYLGLDTPNVPTPTATYSNGAITILWDAITTGINGTALNPDLVTYTITRFPDAETIAEGITATTYTDEVGQIDTLTVLYYYVTAVYGNATSEAGETEHIALGKVYPPYAPEFYSADDLAPFTIIDANNDGSTWGFFYDNIIVYEYNSTNSGNDWLITPPIAMEAGKTYKLTTSAYCVAPEYPERIEVYLGTTNTVAGMTTNIISARNITGFDTSPDTLVAYITPEETGEYYIGYHALSQADMYFLYLTNIHIADGFLNDCPSACTDITATADEGGAYKVNISFTAPLTTYSGDTLSSLKKIEVYRGETRVKMYTNPTPGKTYSFTDYTTSNGTFTYYFYPYDEIGVGNSASVSVYVGIYEPEAVESISAYETENEGEVTFNWTPVTTDANGKSIPEGKVTYNLYVVEDSYTYTLVEEGLTDTTYTYQAALEGTTQLFMQWMICAVTDGGESFYTSTSLVAVGTPMDIPYAESFANGGITYAIASETIEGDGAWGVYADDDFDALTAADDDNGFAAMTGYYTNDCAAMTTLKLNINGTYPGVSFYVNLMGNYSNDTYDIKVYCDREWKTIKHVEMSDYGTQTGWHYLNCSLADYIGKTIQIRFEATTKTYIYHPLDAIYVGELIPDNLAATYIELPSRVFADAEYDVNVTVYNKGLNAASDYTVELFRDGTSVGTAQGTEIAAGQTAIITFSDKITSAQESTIEYSAVVTYEADGDTSDNESGIFTTMFIDSEYPTVTETFEDYDAFTTTAGDWIFVDVDGQPIGTFSERDIPNIDYLSTQSFFIFDGTHEDFNSTFYAHEGRQFLASMYCSDWGACDDWAISPQLYGGEQTISLYAKSYSSIYHESFQILYSTGSTDTADFIEIEDAIFTKISNTWTLYTANLPAGAQRFAIRSFASSNYMFMVDDITYIPAGVSSISTITADSVIESENVYNVSGVLVRKAGESLKGLPKGIYVIGNKKVVIK